ncbi:MAG: bifunctional hydroxymethylpyrimidine kinase/phosphomethylpyrimidine kinase [Nitrosopumilus sp. (ex Thoosa mismalolli)]|nr:bifunctional hydroxymethylpyrimidine kinase/phosphomethylpyrimidine kinase [Nitrosopumilus sp. (ex Thoosa mismalolli)]
MNLLSIGGSDPSAGAGIQSDVKLFSKMDVNCFTIVTAITGQNTSKFGIVEPVSIKILKNQLDSILSDFKIDVIKIGMVYNSKIIKFLFKELKKLKIPIVIDPVIKSTTGGMLIEKSALNDFRKYMIPISTVITPNKFEAEIIANLKVSPSNKIEKIAKKIQSMGAKNIIVTGIERGENQIEDLILEKNSKYSISNKKIFKENHGSGCTYSAIIAYSIANKKSIKESVKFAKEFTLKSIKNAKRIGSGIPITNNSIKDILEKELSSEIQKFTEIKNIYQMIPECQTNFVISKTKPKSTKDILGISGRIVKAGTKVIVAGDLQYGGSKHVATALLTVNKKFPDTKSAINIKYQEKTLKKTSKRKFVVANYDRNSEPKDVKIRGSSIKWGINSAIKNLEKSPDIIFHKGDFGKEPMIIIFGENPKKIIDKITKII